MAYDQQQVLNLLKDSLRAGATDILVKVPARPMFRADDRLIPTPYPEVRPDDTFQFARSLLQIARKELPLAQVQETSFAFGVREVGRFRAHLFRQRGSIGLVIHRMALDPPSLQDLGAPPLSAAIAWGGPGLTLVTAQKRHMALLAALTDCFNQKHAGHLISLEDPIEYLHRDRTAIISQREMGEDATDYVTALQGLRGESPDGVIIHDLPDHHVAEAVLRAAEAGMPVVAGIQGCRTIEATRWFTRMFPAHREIEISERLCIALRGVVAEEKGKVYTLPVSPAVRETILKRRPLPFRKKAA